MWFSWVEPSTDLSTVPARLSPEQAPLVPVPHRDLGAARMSWGWSPVSARDYKEHPDLPRTHSGVKARVPLVCLPTEVKARE